jgi:hypothetical protein
VESGIAPRRGAWVRLVVGGIPGAFVPVHSRFYKLRISRMIGRILEIVEHSAELNV